MPIIFLNVLDEVVQNISVIVLELLVQNITFILIIDGTFFTFLEGFLDQPLNDGVLEFSLKVLHNKPPFLLVLELDPLKDQFQQHF
jgi:hypothetical protein